MLNLNLSRMINKYRKNSMLNLNLSHNVFSDLKQIYPNSSKYFYTDSPLLFDVNFCLLNTIWKENGFSFYERAGLSYAVGNFFSSNHHLKFVNDPSTVFLTGWSDMYEYYVLHKKNNKDYQLAKMEPHYIMSIITMKAIAIDSGIDDERIFEILYSSIKQYLTYLDQINQTIANNYISKELYVKFDSLFTFDWFLKELSNSINLMTPSQKKYYTTLMDNHQLTYNEYKKSYQQLFETLNNHIKNWRKEDFLFELSIDGHIINPKYK